MIASMRNAAQGETIADRTQAQAHTSFHAQETERPTDKWVFSCPGKEVPMAQTKALTTIFDYQSSQVRVIMRGDDPWFVAKDVATVLGIANSRDAIARLKESEKDDV